MEKTDFKTIFTQPILYLAAAVKLMLQPALLMALLYPLQLSPIAYCAIIICKGTTQAAILGVFAQEYGQDSKMAARLIGLTSILQILTLPAISTLCQLIAY